MPNLNKVMLMGHLTRDPDVRVTLNGTAVGNIGLAVNRRTVSGENAKDETVFVDVNVWGKQAELIGQYCQKGDPLFIEGRLTLEQWQDKNTGRNRSRLTVTAESFQFLRSSQSDNNTVSQNSGNLYGNAPVTQNNQFYASEQGCVQNIASNGVLEQNSKEEENLPF